MEDVFHMDRRSPSISSEFKSLKVPSVLLGDGAARERERCGLHNDQALKQAGG